MRDLMCQFLKDLNLSDLDIYLDELEGLDEEYMPILYGKAIDSNGTVMDDCAFLWSRT